jgi:uncharacterized small protein (DUF1192 family)
MDTNQKSLNEVDRLDGRIARYQLVIKRLRAERRLAILRQREHLLKETQFKGTTDEQR